VEMESSFGDDQSHFTDDSYMGGGGGPQMNGANPMMNNNNNNHSIMNNNNINNNHSIMNNNINNNHSITNNNNNNNHSIRTNQSVRSNNGLGFGDVNGLPPSSAHGSAHGGGGDLDHLTPAQRLDGLGVSLPPALPGCLSQLDSDQASTMTITVKVGAVAATVATNSSWELQRAVGLQVLSQLQLASRRNLGIVTIISVSSAGNFNTTVTPLQNSSGGGGQFNNGGGYGQNNAGGYGNGNMVNGSAGGMGGGGSSQTSAESFLAPTRALLREVLGGHGSAVGHGRSALELRSFFESADVDNSGALSADELLMVLSNLGLPTDKTMVQAMMDIADTDGDGFLDYDEFVQFLSVDRSEEADLRLAAFTRFDKDGDGKISAGDLRKALISQGQEVTSDECWRIIQNVTQGDGEFIHYKHFKQLLRPGDDEGFLMNGSGSGGVGVGEASIIVVAHLALDEELILQDDFEQKLCTSGMRLRKCGRMVGTTLKGSGMRTFKLDVLHNQPHMLIWKKGGLKSGLKGKFDLRLVTDVVCGGTSYPSSRGTPALQVHLLSPSGSLSLEARSIEEHRTLLDGLRRLRSRVRTAPHLLGQSHLKKNKDKNATQKNRNSKLDAATQESSLVQAFSNADSDWDGFLDPISIGNVLTAQNLKLSSDEIQSIMNRVKRNGNSYDYREFAIHVVSLADPTLHAKQATERALLDVLKAVDTQNTGLMSQISLGQTMTNMGNVITPDLVNFAARYAERSGQVDVAVFARVAAGLDEQANAQYGNHKRQKSQQIAAEISSRYLSERCMVIYNVVAKHADPDEGNGPGSISPVNFGGALSELGGIPPQQVATLLSKVPTHRKGGHLKWRESQVVNELGRMMVESDETRWLRSFDRWDKNHDGNLTIRELERALSSTSGIERAREEVERIIRSADLDLDGAMSAAEFITIMKIAELGQ